MPNEELPQARRRQRAAGMVLVVAFALAHYFDVLRLRWGNALIGIVGGLAVMIWNRRLARDYVNVWRRKFRKQVVPDDPHQRNGDERRLRYCCILVGVLGVLFGLHALTRP
jgi:hypothetical protein